jgi:hypothetical protein
MGLGRPFRAPGCSRRKPRALPWAAIARPFGTPEVMNTMHAAFGLQILHTLPHLIVAPQARSIAAQGNALGGHTQKRREP